MRKLYHTFFHISDDEKISEKVIFTRMVTTVVVIVSCLLAMGITAYAYFSCGITSGKNTIKAANFQAKIDITDALGEPANPTATQGALHAYSLQPGSYKVKLEMGDNSTASTGFCIVHVDQTQYHTQQIGVDVSAVNERRDCVEFTLDVQQPATVSIESHWGTSSYYNFISADENPLYIKNADPLQVVVVTGAASSSNEPEEEINEENEEATEETGNPEATEQTVYIAKEGESLALYAERHGISVERLAAYNNISDPRVIQIGQQIEIPPDDWVMPEASSQQATKAGNEATEAPAPDELAPDATEQFTQSAEATENAE